MSTPILPSNPSPARSLYATRPGALPARFRRLRVLIVGCGDIGLRVAQALPARVRLLALTSNVERTSELRQRGITPLQGNLDAPASLRRLGGLAHRVLHLAPPPDEGWNGFCVGKSDDVVQPVTYALPVPSTAIPNARSSPRPPRYVQ